MNAAPNPIQKAPASRPILRRITMRRTAVAALSAGFGLVGFLALHARMLGANPPPAAPPDTFALALPVTSITIHTQAVQAQNTVSGQIEPTHVATLAAEVANRIVARPVAQGDRIEAGAVIASLDGDAAQTALQQARDAYAQTRAARLQLETDYERATIETREAIVSAQATVGQAQADAQRARAQQTQAQAGAHKTRAFTRQQELRQAEDALSQAKTEERLARIENSRYVYLVREGASPQQTLDHAQATLESATARRQSAEQALSLANEGARQEDRDVAAAQVSAAAAQSEAAAHQVEAARAALHIAQTRDTRLASLRQQIEGLKAQEAQAQDSVRQAQIAVEKRTLRAPFGGRVLATLADVGDMMSVGTPVVRLGAIRQVKAIFAIPEAVRPTLRLGQKVAVTADARPGQRFAGRITSLGFQADARSRNFSVEIMVDNPRETLLPNMAARLRLSIGAAAPRLLVPVGSVASDGTNVYLFVLRGGKAQRRDVHLGAPLGDQVEIMTGLVDGETIAATPQRLTDNAPVRQAGSAQ